MATTTTQRTAALVVGPPYWSSRWQTRDGAHTPIRDPDARERRKVEAQQEAAGLLLALDALPADCVLILPGDSEAVRLAHRWAEPRNRQALVIPNTDPPSWWSLVMAATLGLQAMGWKVKALACSVGPEPVADELRAAGVFVRLVAPVVPEPEPEEPAVSVE